MSSARNNAELFGSEVGTTSGITDPTCAEFIQACKLREVTDKFERGDTLLKVEAANAEVKGGFKNWLKENNMSRTTASNLMKLAKAVRPEDRAIVAQHIDVGALYEFTRKAAASPALEEAINAARRGEHISAAKAKRMILQQTQVERQESVVVLPAAVRIECCDMRELDIAPGTVDIVISDPPYDEKSVPVYSEVARLAAKCLRPNGWCLVYAGKLFLPEIYKVMSQHLNYAWTFDVLHAKQTLINSLGVYQGGKYILGYRHQSGPKWWEPVSDRLEFAPEKGSHPWQQPVNEARFIRSLCPVGGVVLDCTLGTGTTALAAIMEGRQFIGCDKNQAMIAKAHGRIAELMRGEEVA